MKNRIQNISSVVLVTPTESGAHFSLSPDYLRAAREDIDAIVEDAAAGCTCESTRAAVYQIAAGLRTRFSNPVGSEALERPLLLTRTLAPRGVVFDALKLVSEAFLMEAEAIMREVRSVYSERRLTPESDGGLISAADFVSTVLIFISWDVKRRFELSLLGACLGETLDQTSVALLDVVDYAASGCPSGVFSQSPADRIEFIANLCTRSKEYIRGIANPCAALTLTKLGLLISRTEEGRVIESSVHSVSSASIRHVAKAAGVKESVIRSGRRVYVKESVLEAIESLGFPGLTVGGALAQCGPHYTAGSGDTILAASSDYLSRAGVVEDVTLTDAGRELALTIQKSGDVLGIGAAVDPTAIRMEVEPSGEDMYIGHNISSELGIFDRYETAIVAAWDRAVVSPVVGEFVEADGQKYYIAGFFPAHLSLSNERLVAMLRSSVTEVDYCPSDVYCPAFVSDDMSVELMAEGGEFTLNTHSSSSRF